MIGYPKLIIEFVGSAEGKFFQHGVHCTALTEAFDGRDGAPFPRLHPGNGVQGTGVEQVNRYRTLALEKLEAALARNRKGLAALLAAELERLLGRFEAAEARLAAVPAGALDADQAKALEQIRKYVQSRNAEPQILADK